MSELKHLNEVMLNLKKSFKDLRVSLLKTFDGEYFLKVRLKNVCYHLKFLNKNVCFQGGEHRVGS